MASLTQPGIAPDPRWVAVEARDQNADGQFVYAVKTTGVYCRPSCPARRPKPENVEFYRDGVRAEKAGFRACRRCRPGAARGEVEVALVARLCRLIEQSEDEPNLEHLARAVGSSPFHLQRLFKRIAGVTPKVYAAQLKAQRLEKELAGSTTVTHAMYGAGYNSSARFYTAARTRLGMTPQQYRAGAPDLEIRFAVGQSSLGAILVAATERGICSIALGDDAEELVHDLERQFSRARLLGAMPEFENWVAQVVGFVEEPEGGLELPLDIRGTAFQERVWRALMAIPLGETRSYSEVASALGAPSGARAVARACAQNRIAVAIPCHRVVRSDGSLSGYRWGIERKRELLQREQR